jgi:uncharacterized protein with HEPN domain
MHSERTVSTLRDIAGNIDLAAAFSDGPDSESLCSDQRTVYAVTRCMEIISEASRRLPEDLKARHPEIEGTNMAAAGNIYRHTYQNVAPIRNWEAVQHALPLRDVVQAELLAS